ATDGAVSSEDILEQVLDHLPAGQAAAAAMRLRGDLDLTHPAAQRAAALFSSYGMDMTARLFMAAATEPEQVDGSEPPAEPWLVQDFDAVAARASDGDQDPRAAVARLLSDGEGPERPEGIAGGDLAQAEDELERAAMLREMLSDLLTAPSS
ncbi:MAG: hypothetical protein AAGE03_05475, partial [Pseudomonadota bacterium]